MTGTRQWVQAWLARAWPNGFFGRLACLLVVVAVASHVLALSLLFQLHPKPPPGPDKGPAMAGMVLDIAVRLGAVLLAAWVGARWLSRPLQNLAQATQALAQNPHTAPLCDTHGTREIREASAAVNRLQDQVLAQWAERDRFVAAVSHDLRMPLTRLALRAETLADGLDRARFQKDIREMNTLITATLDHLQGTANPEVARVVDLVALVGSVVDDGQDTGQAIQWHGSPPQPTPLLGVAGQATNLRRCLDNLVTNALHHGGGATVDILHTPPCTRVRVRIQDRGPGIPEQALERVFQPFVQLEGAQTPHPDGVGMGLATARAIAHQHGGTLVLRNRPEGGLCAELDLPVATPAGTPPHRV